MCMFDSQPELLPWHKEPPPPPPTAADEKVKKAGDSQRRKSLLAAGRSSTQKAGTGGVSRASLLTSGKVRLGQ